MQSTTTVVLSVTADDYWDIQRTTETQLLALLDTGKENLGKYVENITTLIEEGEGGSTGDNKVVTNWVAEVTVKLHNLEDAPE